MSRRRLWLGAQVAVTFVLLVLLFWNFDWASFLALVGQISVRFYLYALGVIFVGQVLYAFKWYLALRALGLKVPFQRVVVQYLIATYFNNFLPTMIGGDAARIYYLGQQEGYLNIGTSVFLDRLLGFFCITTLGASLAWALQLGEPAFAVARNALTALFLGFVGVFLAIAFLPIERVSHKLGAAHGWLTRLAGSLERSLIQVRGARHRLGLALGVAASVSAYYALMGEVYVRFFALAAGASVDYGPVLVALLSIAILSNIPITVNGIGLREQLHYLLFSSLAISKEVAVSVSLLIFSNFVVVSVIGYALWLRARLEGNRFSGARGDGAGSA